MLTTVSHASLMVGAMPVLLAAAAALFAGERLELTRLDGPLCLDRGRGPGGAGRQPRQHRQ